MFDYLPIAAIVNGSIFCVHGGLLNFQINKMKIFWKGLSPSLETEEDIAEIDRFQEIPHDGPLTDIMWSDPDSENPGFSISPR